MVWGSFLYLKFRGHTLVQPKTRRLVTEDALEKFIDTQAASPVATIAELPVASAQNRGMIRFVTAENEPYYSNGTSWSSIAQGAQGNPGPAGAGIPAGGSALQVIRKNSAGTTTEWVSMSKALVGLGNADNTSDVDKPVSLAVQNALQGKADSDATSEELARKADGSEVTLALASKADASAVDSALELKADATELGTKADLQNGKVPVDQLPTEQLVNDANVAQQVNGTQTGAAIDQRITTQVTPVVEQITADYIASDAAVVDAAAAAVDANPKVLQLSQGVQLLDPQLNNATTIGRYRQISNNNATVANNCPFPYIFDLEVSPVGSTTGTNIQQKVWGAVTFGGGIAVRSRYNGNWTAWEIFQGESKTLAKVQTMINGAVPSSANRTFPITLSFPGSESLDTRTSVQVRVPIKLPATMKRWRLHLRNRNDRTGTVYPGALSLTGVGVGKHKLSSSGELTGQYDGPPVSVSAPAETSATAADWVSPWSTYEIAGYKEYLLSYGFTSAAQNNHAGYGTAWTTDNANDVMVEAPAGAVFTRQPLLDVWIEAEFDANVPAVAYFDSSSGVGIGAKYVGRQSYANVHALAHGVIPVIYAHSGTAMRVWNVSTSKDQKWLGLSKPDALFWGMGGNDLSDAGDLATYQSRFFAAWPIITAATSTNVYLGTLTPRYGPANTPEFTALRHEANTWLETLPGGAVACWDRNERVTNATDDSLQEKYAALPDTGHLNEAGYARSAAAMVGSMVAAVVR